MNTLWPLAGDPEPHVPGRPHRLNGRVDRLRGAVALWPVRAKYNWPRAGAVHETDERDGDSARC
jgi:hypothetical protein